MHEGFSSVPDLKTRRLRLRPVSDADVLNILLLRTDREVNKFISRERMSRPEEVRKFISRVNKDASEGRSLYWAISTAENPKLIGVICLWNFAEDHLTAELGYELLPKYQKRGFMQEAVACVLHYGFEKIFLKRIEAFTHKKNIRSIKLLKKNGFILQAGRRDINNTSNIIFLLSSSSYQ